MELHAQAMVWMFATACLALAFVVGWGAWKEDDAGERAFALAFGTFAVALVIPLLRGWDAIAAVLTFTLISVCFSLLLMATDRFLVLRTKRWWLVSPPIVVAMAVSALTGRLPVQNVAATAVFLAQAALIGRQLVLRRNDYPMRGRNLMLFAIGLWAAVTIWWLAAGLFSPPFAAFPVFLSIVLMAGGFLSMGKDRAVATLQSAAARDLLTGCWNRVRIVEVAEQELTRLKRYGYPATLVLIDIDHFKAINDQHGRDIGDGVLRTFAEMVRTTVRSADVVGRWQGEQFVVILPSSGFHEVVPLANRLRKTLEGRKFPDGVQVTACFGIAVARSTDSALDWASRAEAALQTAKAEGRNQTRVEGLELGLDELSSESVRITQLRWRKTYEIGNAAIDAQHRAIFEQANAFLRLGTEIRDKVEILAIAGPLLKAIKDHFAFEDAILAKAVGLDASLARAHSDMHAYLAARADGTLDRFLKDGVGVAALFHFVVFEFVTQHILIEDRRVASILAAAPHAGVPGQYPS
jgi:diguanylate cyclase (GGDEF)-like protein/hemerythrin-like metal-binding protein